MKSLCVPDLVATQLKTTGDSFFLKKSTITFGSFAKSYYLCIAIETDGALSERLGTGLQNHSRRFDSATHLKSEIMKMVSLFLFLPPLYQKILYLYEDTGFQGCYFSFLISSSISSNCLPILRLR